jgi:UDP-N-acetyl-D-mannosaminuronate dehydrogenase
MEKQDAYPTHSSWARFFRNQEGLKSLKVIKELAEAVNGADALVLAVRHEPYLKLDPDQVVQWIGKPTAIIDCFGILKDHQIRRYFELGCEVKGAGRGHINRIKREVLGRK